MCVSATEFLKNGRGLMLEMRALKDAKKAAYDEACGRAVDCGAERVQTSAFNGTEESFVKFSQYSFELDKRIEEICEYRIKMLKLIQGLASPVYRALLTRYYIGCETWEQVAENMNYSVTHIHRLHEAAIKKVEEIINK